ncbi:MAG TPA: HD domain-containing protein [Chloroflexota bacterium]|nr:HD domain-containing protein [Chloroflexota bacterium]
MRTDHEHEPQRASAPFTPESNGGIASADLSGPAEQQLRVAGTALRHPEPALASGFSVPTRRNQHLEGLLERIRQDAELHQLWRCANVNAIDRSHITDHGPVHVRIVANIALRILRLLFDAGVEASVVRDHGLRRADAEVIVVLAAALHDIGISVHRHQHERYSLILAAPKARELLSTIYDEPERTIMVSEVLHAIVAHDWEETCLTIEAGCVKVADALDMSKGRSRIPFQAGKLDIHSVSAAAIDRVIIGKGPQKPISIAIDMNNSAGIFQVDELLKRKIDNSSIRDYIDVLASIHGDSETRIVPVYNH